MVFLLLLGKDVLIKIRNTYLYTEEVKLTDSDNI